MEINNIYNEDCLVGMKKISRENVDALITDPPYNISRKNNFKSMGRSGIDFGEWDKGFNEVSWIPIAVDKVKKGGNVVIFISWRSITPIIEELEKNKCEVKDIIRVEKSNPMPRNRDRRFIVDYEIAIWAVKKGAKWTFNRKSDTYERPLIKTSVTPRSEKIYSEHPTQKSLLVIEWLLERLTNNNDLVLDPFIGSGTLPIASLNNNRKYIGFELDESYYKNSLNRIKKHKEFMEIL